MDTDMNISNTPQYQSQQSIHEEKLESALIAATKLNESK
jgi:hypothetical protein